MDAQNAVLAVRGDFSISAGKCPEHFQAVCELLDTTAWAKARPRSVMRKAMQHSLCFCVFEKGQVVGFARAITDFGTFAYLADVVIRPEHRGKGLGLWLLETVLSHPELRTMRRWMLVTQDAHGLYRKVGFAGCQNPSDVMEKLQPYPSFQ